MLCWKNESVQNKTCPHVCFCSFFHFCWTQRAEISKIKVGSVLPISIIFRPTGKILIANFCFWVALVIRIVYSNFSIPDVRKFIVAFSNITSNKCKTRWSLTFKGSFKPRAGTRTKLKGKILPLLTTTNLELNIYAFQTKMCFKNSFCNSLLQKYLLDDQFSITSSINILDQLWSTCFCNLTQKRWLDWGLPWHLKLFAD